LANDGKEEFDHLQTEPMFHYQTELSLLYRHDKMFFPYQILCLDLLASYASYKKVKLLHP
jgi:hypothetical protein